MSARGRRREKGAPGRAERLGGTFAEGLVWLLLFAVAFTVVPTARESFRLPKLLVGEWLALASMIPLALRLRGAGPIGWRRIWALPAVRAVLPLVAVATLGWAFTAHPAHVRSGLADLAIGAAALVAWSAGLSRARLERLLGATVLVSALLVLPALFQAAGFHFFQFTSHDEGTRIGMGSLAGNAGDMGDLLALAGVLALVCVLAGRRGAEERGGAGRWLALVGLLLAVTGLGFTRTLTALLALAVGSAVAGPLLVRRRRNLAWVGAGFAAVALVVVLGPFHARVAEKLADLRSGQVNALLTGRLDGWRAAVWMLGRHPVLGVGQGAYAAEFGQAKLDLSSRGVAFYGSQYPFFGNAHNDVLELGADLGLAGLAALAWGLWVLVGAARRVGHGAGGAPRPREAALAWGGLAVLVVLAAGHFAFAPRWSPFPPWCCSPGSSPPAPSRGRWRRPAACRAGPPAGGWRFCSCWRWWRRATACATGCGRRASSAPSRRSPPSSS